ncbi:hypothetical protein EST38_g617 [Candolleomyces aberdarensis]|uniref:RFX-type winged-helix domain-containing protein n=1 Tax=Candolleomyces aberdarensis TaxID=2316362 RepID=A0A4Q2DZR4_9AGAR|nr:hypothetical protein EST38_g617 [Candolleomyces aberdarensis]
MTAVNMQMMPTNVPGLDFHSLHSRSNSLSSSSTHSSHSRPQSAHGAMQRMHSGVLDDDLYRATYGLGPHQMHDATHILSFTQPPNHNITNPALKGPLRASHIRARAAASPYPRDTDSVHSSSSETEDLSLFLGNPSNDYPSMYSAHQMPPSQEAMHAAGAFGRMNLASDHGLDKLAANVRAATTTSASDRAKQIFVQAWLSANYAPYPDGNVPRQGLYFSYRRVCDQYGIPHINTATLGKAIRLCFPTIKTRRLGVRGNSKYHYCGIRAITTSEIDWLREYVATSNAQAQANRAKNEQEAQERGEGRSDEDDDDDSEGGSAAGSKRSSLVLSDAVKNAVFGDEMSDKTPTAANLLSQAQSSQRPSAYHEASIRRHPQHGGALELQAHSPASGSASSYQHPQTNSVRQMPHFPSIEDALGSSSASPHNIAAREVWGWFQEHLDLLLENVKSYRIDQFEMNVRTFWNNLSGQHREIVHAPAIAGLMAKADAIVYDEILEFLRLQMLSPIPTATLSQLRSLAVKMEKILLMALEGYGNTFVEPKVELGARFGHLVLRYLDIYQVTQALNTVLTNPKQLTEMRRSWDKVDFESVRNQSALVCNCRHEDLVQLLEGEFKALLATISQSSEPVNEVMAWADKCCERLMGAGRASHVATEERGVMNSRSVLIRWGYVTSQVMRDLTIRSDPAFGAFQILKLFLDDWIAVNVLRTVALSTNSVAASVEPMMQQQYLSLSPMAGQENFGALDARASHMMAQTPTSSSMLAALQQDFPTGPLDPTSFGADPYGTIGYMDSSAAQDESLSSGHQASLAFADFTGSANPFDGTSFNPHDLGSLSATGTPASDSEHDNDTKPDQSS